MYQPNLSVVPFCDWLVNFDTAKLSGSQTSLVNIIRNAANSATPVTNTEWLDFNRLAGWRKAYYDVYASFAIFTEPQLQAGLLHSWSFDGNGNDSVGSVNVTLYGCSYASSFGLINEGIGMVSGDSYGYFPNIYLPSSYSLLTWHNPLFMGSVIQGLLCNYGSGSGVGFDITSGKYFVTDGSNYYYSSAAYSYGWHCVVACFNGSTLKLYVDNLLVGLWSIASPISVISHIGAIGPGYLVRAYYDIAAVWNYALPTNLISSLYNGGAGIQYPF